MGRAPWALRAGEFVLRRICHQLPVQEAEDCFAEWSAELPAIWDDEALPRWRAATCVLAYCLGQRHTAQSLTPPPDDDPAEMLRAMPLIAAMLILVLFDDVQGLVGEIGTYTAEVLSVIGAIALRPRRAKRSNDSGRSG
ncbi:hypothetical protein [Streptomyces sp. NBC_00564]|uniref:hypothetical protein n=1 Tax=Streptomyces sp. NBC_00564 TaxID=2903663 RepID=UPI002FCD757E|nr:hypothetical protein OG256_45785 [Streptomyces sp. NBC_00564]